MTTNTTKTLADELRDMGYDCSTEGEALLERAAKAIERAAERVTQLETQLRDAIDTLDIISVSNQAPGHVNYRSKGRVGEIARQTASDARAALSQDPGT